MGTASIYARDVNSLFCGKCGAQIPVDSIFCPMCGFKAALPGAVTLFQMPQVDALAIERARADERARAQEQVRARDAWPPGPVPAPRPAPALAQPETAAPRGAVVDPSLFAPPPGRIPVTPRPVRIVLGALFLVLAAWLAIFFLPRHRPLSGSDEVALAARSGQGEVLRQRQMRFTEEAHVGGNVGAGALALAGLGLVLSGALHRAQGRVRCRRCAREVIAWKGPFGLHCPLGEHYARVQWLMVGLTALFWAGLLAVAAVIGLWLL